MPEVGIVEHVLGDGDTIVLGWQLTDGREYAVTAYVDHNLGTLLKDAFPLELPVRAASDVMVEHGDEPFTWGRVPETAVDRVRVVLELVDACCAEFFDVEFRAACRRLHARAVAGTRDQRARLPDDHGPQVTGPRRVAHPGP